MRALGLLGVYSGGAGVVAAAALAFSHGLRAPPGPAKSLDAATSVLFVLAGAIGMHYAFLFNQSATGFGELSRLRQLAKERGEKPPTLSDVKYGRTSARVLAADRCMGNFLEQLPPFVLSLLAYTLFVSANGAAALGWAWLGFRSYYPLAYSRPFPTLLLSTMPAYACVWWMICASVYKAAALS